MMEFGNLPPSEIERRRISSIEALHDIEEARFLRDQQERIDRFYWKNGPCCAGCDHWAYCFGQVGICNAAAPVSGEQVIKSLGFDFCTYTPPPGRPYTNQAHHCGQFKDDFDWLSLGELYLRRIGAPQTSEDNHGQ